MLNCLAERGTSNNFGVIAVHQVKGLMFIPTCGGMYGWGTVPRKNGEDLADASAGSLAAEHIVKQICRLLRTIQDVVQI